MAEKCYIVPEYFTAAQFHYVTAASKAEALQKVIDGEQDWTSMADPVPSAPMSVREIRVDHQRKPGDGL